MNAFTVRTSRIDRIGRPTILVLLVLLIMASSMAPALAVEPTQPAELEAELTVPEVELLDPPEATLPDPTDPGGVTPPPEGVVPLPDPGIVDDVVVPPPPRQTLTLTPTCDPAGFDFVLKVNAPEGGAKVLQWRPSGTGLTYSLPTSGSGSVASGEGTFEARGLSLAPGGGVHTIMRWQLVTVRCETERPTVTIDVQPECDPDRIAYAIAVDDEPNAPTYTAEWRELGGNVHTVEGQTGHLPTGEGAFEVRGLLSVGDQQEWRSDWVKVIVDCTGDPIEPPDPGVDIRPGIPNFTG